jgi:hypothetical protein
MALAVCGLLGGCGLFSGRHAGEAVARAAVVESVRTVYIAIPATGVERANAADSEKGPDDVEGLAVPSNTPLAGQTVSASPMQQITVRIGHGEPRAVVQPPGESFTPGEDVQLLSQDGRVWISR